MPTRRQLLKLGLAGAAALAALRWFSTGGSRKPVAVQYRTIIAAVIPAILEGTLPAAQPARNEAIARSIAAFGELVSRLPLPVQDEVADLFQLLDLGLARRFVGGLSADWSEADPAAVGAFLQRWRFSRWSLLQQAYHALHDLTLGAWYAQPESWASIHYPGPPQVA